MIALRKIATQIILLSGCMAALCAQAKNKTNHSNKKKPEITIGFQTGKNSFLTAGPSINSKTQFKSTFGNYHQVTVKKDISNHFKAEAGIAYYQRPVQLATTQPFGYATGIQKPYSVAVPMNLQYYMLPVYSKIKPYCGLGFQYNHMLSNPTSSKVTELHDNNTNPAEAAGTNYVSIVFTQGVVFEVSTKIQFTQSFHFISSANEKTIGLDLGIGFTLP